MEIAISAFIGSFLGSIIGSLIGNWLFVKLEEKKAIGEMLLPSGVVHALTRPEQRAEFMPPMTDEEVEEFEKGNSSRGDLLSKVLNKAPWTSDRLKSQSSDSSSRTE